jgi:acetyl-CoA/propionyl-CoA/long-chain acyl-CoA carboxylase, biotin carboxylase, biotin carboxyl carrier protein
MPPFARVLVANRGEIAVRIFRTLRELGVGTVAVYSEADRGAVHTRVADEAYLIGPPPAAESYLDIERLVETALRADAEAIHPGYGFLAENASFARSVEEAGLTWIGPPPEAIELMGSKTAARTAMQAAGVPIVPGTTDPVESADRAIEIGNEIGWPIALKAASGGGGKGLKLVSDPEGVPAAFESAQREGQAYFADPSVYVERYLEDPRHVEVQVLADAHDNVIHLGERECTIQRRHQKLVEETPSPAVDDALRARIGAIAVNAATAAGYRSAGTIEGLLSAEGDYYFLEMNTRIQVEHTVTELVTGLDLVREQVFIAAGSPLTLRQEDVQLRGHAIECRINAESPSSGFLPAPGRITSYREPAGPGVRVDSGVEAGLEVSGFYDSLLAKLVVHGLDREHARARMLRALGEYEIGGVETLIGFHRALLSEPCFVEAGTCRGIVESEELAEKAKLLSDTTTTVSPHSDGKLRPHVLPVELDGRRFDVRVLRPEPPHAALARSRRDRGSGMGQSGAAADAVVSPMQGTVLHVRVTDGQEVAAGDVLCIVEAMKMENEIAAHRSGVVTGLAVSPGEAVTLGQVICILGQEGEPGPA